ncbi:Hypp1126 [Branchiostoma lanceolatum]|uniref:Hypp1126 protein n=1 Tax=Branchiostoma lanceolatum TaxID=7740 RepID=A0A8J9ZGK2_BRALA|nr:Hypp1126 [Branchiostoma lanceolatum]
MGNNQAARIRQRAKNLEWTDEILSPGEVLNKYDLPVFVAVAREDPQADLTKDEIFLLRSSYSERDVFARKVHMTSGRLYGPLLTIPLKHPAKFVIFKKVFYSGVNELLRANPFPESFRVEENVTWGESGRSQEAFELLGLLSTRMSQTQNKDGGPAFAKDLSKKKPKVINMSAEVGDCLTAIDKTEPVEDFEEVDLKISQVGGKKETSTLKKIKRSFKGKRESKKTKTATQPMGYMVCTNQTGGLVCLHTDCTGRFSAYLPEQYTMEELLENFELPGDVEVVGGQLPNDHPNFGGRLRLLSFCTETFIVVNGLPMPGEVTEAGAQAVMTAELSIDSDVRFTPASKSSPQNTELLKLLQGHLQRVRP